MTSHAAQRVFPPFYNPASHLPPIDLMLHYFIFFSPWGLPFLFQESQIFASPVEDAKYFSKVFYVHFPLMVFLPHLYHLVCFYFCHLQIITNLLSLRICQWWVYFAERAMNCHGCLSVHLAESIPYSFYSWEGRYIAPSSLSNNFSFVFAFLA